MLCAELVELRWRDKHGFERRDMAHLEDISLSGACLQAEKPFVRERRSPYTMETANWLEPFAIVSIGIGATSWEWDSPENVSGQAGISSLSICSTPEHSLRARHGSRPHAPIETLHLRNEPEPRMSSRVES